PGVSSTMQDQLRLLIEVSEAIATHRDLPALCRDLTVRLPGIVAFDSISLCLHDPAKNVMRIAMLGSADRDFTPADLDIPMDQSISGRVFMTQQPAIVRSQSDVEAYPIGLSLMRAAGIECFCMLPLTTIVRPLGAMGFGSARPHRFDDSELEFLQLVVRQVAVAVDNVLHAESARLAQQQLTCERDRLRLLLDVNNAVGSHLELDDVFAAVSECLRRVIPHDGSSLLLYDPETQQFRAHVLRFASKDRFTEVGRTETRHVKSPAGVAIATRRTALFGEADLRRLASETSVAQRLLDDGVRTFCCGPLISRDCVLGTLNVGSRAADAFSPHHVELLGLVAKQIAIAVDNGIAYRQIAELKEKLNSEKLYLEDEIRTDRNFEEIVGDSAALKNVLRQVEIVAATDSTVLVQGETGTGK